MSNLLKQCYVVSSGTGTRIINSNDGVRQKLKELQQEQAPEQADVSAEDGQENAPASIFFSSLSFFGGNISKDKLFL